MTPTYWHSVANETALIRSSLRDAAVHARSLAALVAALVPTLRCEMPLLAAVWRREGLQESELQGAPRSGPRRSQTGCLRHAAAVSCIVVRPQRR